MPITRHDKVGKLFESRAKAETELERLQEKVRDAVEKKNRRVPVERFVTSCDEAITKMFAKPEQLLKLAGKTGPLVDGEFQSSTNVTKSKHLSRTSASRTSRQSRTSSQRQRDILIAKQLKEAMGRQNEAALRIAKQQQELEPEFLQEE